MAENQLHGYSRLEFDPRKKSPTGSQESLHSHLLNGKMDGKPYGMPSKLTKPITSIFRPGRS